MNVYDRYEELDSFTPEELAAYRKMLLEKTRPQVEFIRRHLFDELAPIHISDLCCGNGRLLVGLAEQKLICCGVGRDISVSRINFACAWVQQLKIDHAVEFHSCDITNDIHPNANLITCITGAFNYFKPIGKDLQILKMMKESSYGLNRGAALLEIYNPSFEENKKTWFELPLEDKFKYYLEDWQYDPINRFMRHEKIFIGKDGKIDTGRVETLAYYTEQEIRDILKLTGFKDVEIYGGWNDEHYSDESDKMVVVAHV